MLRADDQILLDEVARLKDLPPQLLSGPPVIVKLRQPGTADPGATHPELQAGVRSDWNAVMDK